MQHVTWLAVCLTVEQGVDRVVVHAAAMWVTCCMRMLMAYCSVRGTCNSAITGHSPKNGLTAASTGPARVWIPLINPVAAAAAARADYMALHCKSDASRFQRKPHISLDFTLNCAVHWML